LNTENNENPELTIYNLKDQKIKTFPINSPSDQQFNSVVWNGTDETGKPVSSGIYFYKLRSGDFEKANKMILMK